MSQKAKAFLNDAVKAVPSIAKDQQLLCSLCQIFGEQKIIASDVKLHLKLATLLNGKGPINSTRSKLLASNPHKVYNTISQMLGLSRHLALLTKNKCLSCKSELDRGHLKEELSEPSKGKLREALAFIFLYKKAAANSHFVEHFMPVELAASSPDLSQLSNEVALRSIASELPSTPEEYAEAKTDRLKFHLLKWLLVDSPVRLAYCAETPLEAIKLLKLHQDKLESYKQLGTHTEWYKVSYTAQPAFKASKKTRSNASNWAWHGTALHNVHNILRSGLKVMSNTKYQANGARHGAGIYCSSSLSAALRVQSRADDGASSLLLVEISKEVSKMKSIFVVPKEEYIRVAYLALFRSK